MNEPQRVVSDAGPLISLEKPSGGYPLIARLYERIIVPPQVLEEIAQGRYSQPQEYLKTHQISDLIEVRTPGSIPVLSESQRLHEGEVQAIALARELNLPLLIKETVGRRVALAAGVKISGIAGQILRAYREEVVDRSAAQSLLGELLAGGRINRKIYLALLNALN